MELRLNPVGNCIWERKDGFSHEVKKKSFPLSMCQNIFDTYWNELCLFFVWELVKVDLNWTVMLLKSDEENKSATCLLSAFTPSLSVSHCSQSGFFLGFSDLWRGTQAYFQGNWIESERWVPEICVCVYVCIVRACVCMSVCLIMCFKWVASLQLNSDRKSISEPNFSLVDTLIGPTHSTET